MDPKYGYVSAMRKYATFSGRSPRREYWLFLLVYVILAIVASGIDQFVLGFGAEQTGPASGVVTLAHLLPSLAVTVRRLHDIGRTGWWVALPFAIFAGVGVLGAAGMEFLGDGTGPGAFGAFGIVFVIATLVAFVLSIVLLVFTLLRSEDGPNRYGPHPYGQVDADVF